MQPIKCDIPNVSSATGIGKKFKIRSNETNICGLNDLREQARNAFLLTNRWDIV